MMDDDPLPKLLVVLLLLTCFTFTEGHYDRSGPQHRITWGRGNSHSSAVFGTGPVNVTAVVEHKARLPCNVRNLGHKDVSWIRQRDLHILTVAAYTYTTDDRFKVFHQPGSEQWDLDITSVTFRDAGVYECQVSTSPKASLPITLHVLGVQQAVIPGTEEVHIQTGSTINLSCEVSAGADIVGNIQWLHGSLTLNYSSPRGGVSLEVEKTPYSTTSKLYITRALRGDSGNYTCAPQFARAASVLVHVVDAGEESAAAVHSGAQCAESGILARLAHLLAVCLITQLAVCCSYCFYNCNGCIGGSESLFSRINAASLSLCDKQYRIYRESITGLQWDRSSSEYMYDHESSSEATRGGPFSRKEFVSATTLKNME